MVTPRVTLTHILLKLQEFVRGNIFRQVLLSVLALGIHRFDYLPIPPIPSTPHPLPHHPHIHSVSIP